MRKYPVYYQGKKLKGEWDPFEESLWDAFCAAVVIPDSVYRHDYLAIFEKDKVVIVKRLSGEGG